MPLLFLQDKVLFHRLETVAHAIEKGEWTAPRRYYTTMSDIMSDSQSSTPLGGTPTGTPRVESHGAPHDYNLLASSADGMVRVVPPQNLKHHPSPYGLGGFHLPGEQSDPDEGSDYYGRDELYGSSTLGSEERRLVDHERNFRVALTEVGSAARMRVAARGGGKALSVRAHV